MAASGKRNAMIDAMKFFAIALVPLQHLLNLRHEFSGLPGAHAWVVFMVSFDMPLFMFLSGYVLFGREGRDPVSFLTRKAQALLVPYFAWITVEMIAEKLPLSQWPGKLAQSAIQPHAAYQMWFLWVLFVLFVLFTLVRLVSRADWWFVTVAVACEALRFVSTTKVAGVDKILLLAPYLVLGYLVAKYRERLVRFDLWIAIVSVPVFAALSFVPQPSVPVQLAIGVTGIVAVWVLHRALPARLIDAEAWVGQKSLGIYAGQMVVMPFVIVGEAWAGVALSFATTMAASTSLAWALEFTPVTRAVFLGQWPKPPKRPAPQPTVVAEGPGTAER